MTPERWQQVAEAFEAALELKTEERSAFLANLSSSDPSVATEVEALLAEDALQEQTPPSGIGAATLIGKRIGGYQILRVVGEGGMGRVFEAEQEHPRRAVALKLLKPGLPSAELLRRFERESQALGRLQHPGIAQIYEAGVADTGCVADAGFGLQPYFAMEFVHGMPLGEYAESHRLTARQRLEIMAKICDAVEHAHQRGIIHRDLKPGNILVDEAGQPKILDFGVARVTDSDVQATRQTDVGQLIGTLAYMSPEQVTADPLELDTRSDVYALGVILYEVLANRLPYELSHQLLEAVRAIREADPTRLSLISRAYRGDVETIVAKALEKDKGRRYCSAAALATDIRRYLVDEPIMARPASTSYQLRKFARRHRALMTAIATVFLVLVAGVVVSTTEALRARRAEQTAQAVNEFLQNDLLAQASASTQAAPGTKPDRDLKVRTALDRAASKIAGKFAKQPLVEASIRQTIGVTYKDLGLYSEGQQQMERAVALRRRLQGEENSETLVAMNELARLYMVAGRSKEAEQLLRKILQLRRRLSGEESPGTSEVMADLATVYTNEGKYAEAEPLYVKVMDIKHRTAGDENPDTLTTINNLGILYRREGKYQQAEALYRKVFEISRRVLGEEHPNTLISMNTLGLVYTYEHRFLEAEDLLIKTLEARRRILGPEHPSTLLTMNNLALVYMNEGKDSDAEALLTVTLSIRRRVSGPEHPDTLLAIDNLAQLYMDEGKYAQAEALLTGAPEISARVSGKDHHQTLVLKEELARVWNHAGKHSQAAELLTAVLESRRRVAGNDDGYTLRAAYFLARVRLEQQEYRSAEIILRPTVMSYQIAHPENWLGDECKSLLGVSLAGQKQYAAAEPFLISGYEEMKQRAATIPPNSRRYLEEARKALVQFYQDWGKPEKAAEWRRKQP
jgi:eukaryotic-like serine/threonine-protein kinase